MFREMKNSDSELAREVQAFMASGRLVPDEVTYAMVKNRTSRPDTAGSYVLDGYPRTAVQAEQLEELAKEQGKKIQAIEVDVPKEELMKRLTGRRSCPECGEIYNIYSKPPQVEGVCDFHPNAVLEHRADDYEEKVNVRLDTYDQQTRPLLEYYKKSGRLKKVVGTGEVDTIYAEVEKLLGL